MFLIPCFLLLLRVSVGISRDDAFAYVNGNLDDYWETIAYLKFYVIVSLNSPLNNN